MAIPPGMHRVTVDIPIATHEAMQDASLEDGVTIPARLRALAVLWQQDSQLAPQVAALAHQMRAAARRQAVEARRSTLAARERSSQK